jgi:hypothetical protein
MEDVKKFLRDGYAILAEFVEILDACGEEVPPRVLQRMTQLESLSDRETGEMIISELVY